MRPDAMIQPEIFEPTHASPWEDRLQWSSTNARAEQVYLERWRDMNEDSAKMVRHLLRRDDVTQRDSVVAASFAQWLGTNVGFGFIQACERAVGGLSAIQDLWNLRWFHDVDPTWKEQAEVLAAPAKHLMARAAHKELVENIAKALHQASMAQTFRPRRGAPPPPRAVLVRD